MISRAARKTGLLLLLRVIPLLLAVCQPRPAAAQGWLRVFRYAEEAAEAERLAAATVRAVELERTASRVALLGAEIANEERLASRLMAATRTMMATRVDRIEQATVIVAVHEGSLVTVSNFRRAGQTASETMKWDESMSLPSVVASLEYEPPTPWDAFVEWRKDQILRATKDSTEFLVDQEVFANPRFQAIDFGISHRVSMVDELGQSRPVYDLWQGQKYERVAAYGEFLYAAAGDTTAPAFFSQLRAQRFDGSGVRILPLYGGNAVLAEIDRLFPGSRLAFDGSSPDGLRQALEGARGMQVLVLGHVDEQGFLVENPETGSTATLPANDLYSIAAQSQVDVVPVAVSPIELSTPDYQLFGFLDVVRRLANALNARTQADFYDRLGSEDLRLVLNDTPDKSRFFYAVAVDPVPGVPRSLSAATIGGVGQLRPQAAPAPSPGNPPPDPPQGDDDGSIPFWVWAIVVIAVLVWLGRKG